MLILDFEANHDEKGAITAPEIIEWPCIAIDTKDLSIHSTFHHFIQPLRNSKLSPSISKLTGITQSQIDKAQTIDKIVAKWNKWISSNFKLDSACVVTCGNWDIQEAWESQKTIMKIWQEIEEKELLNPLLFDKFINIKEIFTKNYGIRKKTEGMKAMMGYFGIEMGEGERHHSGISDARNIVKIVLEMLSDGKVLEVTSSKRVE